MTRISDSARTGPPRRRAGGGWCAGPLSLKRASTLSQESFHSLSRELSLKRVSTLSQESFHSLSRELPLSIKRVSTLS